MQTLAEIRTKVEQSRSPRWATVPMDYLVSVLKVYGPFPLKHAVSTNM